MDNLVLQADKISVRAPCKVPWMESISGVMLGPLLYFYSPFRGQEGLKMIVSHRAPSCLNMSFYRATWTNFKQKSYFAANSFSDPGQKCGIFTKMPISSSGHSHKYLTYTGRWISTSLYGRNQYEQQLLKLLTCYKPGRSKTLFERRVMGSTFSQKYSGPNIQSWKWVLCA